MTVVFWLLGIIAALVIGHLFLHLVKLWKYARIINKIPGLIGIPYYRLLFTFWVPFEDVMLVAFNLLRKQLEAGRSIVKIWFGPVVLVAILKGSACEVILKNSKYVNRSSNYNHAKKLAGNSLLRCKRETWEVHRKFINSSFHASVIVDFIPIINEKVAICLQKLEKVKDGRIFDVMPYLRCLTLDVTCECVAGVRVNAQENTCDEFVRSFKELGEVYSKRFSNPLLHFSCVYNLTPYRRQELKHCDIIHTFVQKVIRDRMQFLEQRKLQQNGVKENDQGGNFGKNRCLATLDLLIEGEFNGMKYTEEEILYEMTFFIAAGTETTSDLISFAILLLGCHPDCQKRAQQEMDSVLGESDRPVTSVDLPRLKYLDAVIKETNRLFPAIPLSGREMDEDVVIDGYTIPAGTTVGIMIYVIHRDPEIFPEPDKFDPERFLGTNGPGFYEYIPFSQGPRNCIGSKVAKMEAKIILTHILRKYDIVSHDKPENLKLVALPDTRSYYGVKVSLRRRMRSAI